MSFKISSCPKALDLTTDALFLIINNGQILADTRLTSGFNKFLFSHNEIFSTPLSVDDQVLYLGSLNENETDIYAFQPKNAQHFITVSRKYINPRKLLDHSNESFVKIVLRGLPLIYWNSRTSFCGYCGSKTILSKDEYVKDCQTCHNKFYPQYSPAVIILVWRGDEILLGQPINRENKKLYCTFAGFLEAGETTEEAVHRELYEELGIRVTNIHYHSIQPWPFPNSLMIGYTAEYKSGQLKIDKTELDDVRWFHYTNLPELPRRSSISRQLIDDFVNKLHLKK